LPVACLIVMVSALTIIEIMKDSKLVEAYRPSTDDWLFAGLSITKNLIFSDRREVGRSRAGPSILFFSAPANRASAGNQEPILSQGLMGASARRRRATWQSLPMSIAMHGCSRREAAASLPGQTQGKSPGLFDHPDDEGVLLARRHNGELRRKGLDTRGNGASRVSDE